MAAKLVRCLLQLLVRTDDLKLSQQLRAVVAMQMIERLLADRRAGALLELDDRLARGDQAEAGRPVGSDAGQRQQQARDAGIFQPAPLGVLDGMLQRLEPVEDQQAVVLDEQPGQRAALLIGLEDRLATIAEVVEGLLEEELRRRIASLVAPLTVEGMHEHPQRPAPAGIAHPPQPLDDDPCLARSALGMQREDPRALRPRPVERCQLLLPADEAFAIDAQLVGPFGGRIAWSPHPLAPSPIFRPPPAGRGGTRSRVEPPAVEN